jgi:1-acyl-sn-glycerol-3-phosphate acyltransferase
VRPAAGATVDALMDGGWRVPVLWRALQATARAVVFAMARLRVSGEVPAELRRGPLILAANHVSPFDPVVLAAACRAVGVAPRFLATGGIFRAPVVGWVMRRCGHIRVDRRSVRVALALPAAVSALAAGSVVLVYPEGRIGLDPWMWPERGKTGTARMAFLSGATVVPVAQWGAHAVLPYTSPRGLAASVARSVWRRPRVWVRFGAPVDLSGLDGSTPGQAVLATERIVAAVAQTLAPLRVAEPRRPGFVDVTRPADTSRARRPAPLDVA